MRKPLSKTQQAFGAGRTVEQLFKQEAVLTRFETLAKGIPEDQWIYSETLCAFARQHKDRYFVPERFLAALREATAYDTEPSAYSLVAGVIIPELSPLQEVEDVNEETQQAA